MSNHIHLVAGLAFGDEGKGTIVDYLVRTTGARTVVRYNGGAQAAHNVVAPDGTHHCFSQFGSGMLAGADTYLSRYMLIEPFALQREYFVLKAKVEFDLWKRLYIEESAPILTPYHKIMNQAREKQRGHQRHGSCGLGIGELRSDQVEGRTVLTAGDLGHKSAVDFKLKQIADYYERISAELGFDVFRQIISLDKQYLAACYEVFAQYAEIVPDGTLHSFKGDMVFEGAQGMLLDETHGFAPYNTWTDTTFGNAYKVIGHDWRPEITKIGVLRTYFTRHGAGPFPTEDEKIEWPDHNKWGEFQGNFRHGNFDLLLAKYALNRIGCIDGLALTHVDRLPEFPAATSYYLGNEYESADHFQTSDLMMARPGKIESLTPETLADRLGCKLMIKSTGQTAIQKEKLCQLA